MQNCGAFWAVRKDGDPQHVNMERIRKSVSMRVCKDTVDVTLELYVNSKALKAGDELVGYEYDTPDNAAADEPPAKRGRCGGKQATAKGRGKGRGKNAK